MSKTVSILFTHTSALIGGGNKVLLSVFAGLDRARYSPISVLPEHGPMEAELKKLQVPSIILDVRPGKGRLQMGVAMLRLARHIRRNRVSIVHANDPFTYRVASLAAGMTRAAAVCHFHHPDQDVKSVAWAFGRVPAAVLTPTEYVKEKVCEWWGDRAAGMVRVVGNPIDTDWFSPASDVREVRARLGISKTCPQITIIGALTPHKGHDCFLYAAKLIVKRYPETKFNVVGSAQSGDRAWAERLQEQARQLGVEKSIHFWGFVSDLVSRDLLSASDIFMLPTQLEGFGLVIAEALACGVPVITSAIRPLDEIVVNAKSGFLVSPNDPEQFALRACDLLESPKARRDFGDFGRRFVRERYGASSVVERIVEQYTEILNVREK